MYEELDLDVLRMIDEFEKEIGEVDFDYKEETDHNEIGDEMVVGELYKVELSKNKFFLGELVDIEHDKLVDKKGKRHDIYVFENVEGGDKFFSYSHDGKIDWKLIKEINF